MFGNKKTSGKLEITLELEGQGGKSKKSTKIKFELSDESVDSLNERYDKFVDQFRG